jgi:transcriptional regulator with GAF, ATPase, and Fis domain
MPSFSLAKLMSMGTSDSGPRPVLESSRQEQTNGTGLPDLSPITERLFERARRDPRFQSLAWIEREMVIQALSQTNGNQARAAQLLGVARTRLRRSVERLNIHCQVVFH